MVVAGGVIPKQDYAFLNKAGVAGIFGPGTTVSSAAKNNSGKTVKPLNLKASQGKSTIQLLAEAPVAVIRC